MHDRLIATGSALLIIAVAFGAFGAHGLKARLTPEALSQWRTGVEYQFIHALGILMLAALADRLKPAAVRWASRAFVGGTLLFSGSLYLLSTRELFNTYSWTLLIGPVTPLGGLLYMAGWTVLLITALRGPDRG
jgi:uncharacterized membrane protein YgdD (TMEM256/DUF423 family)